MDMRRDFTLPHLVCIVEAAHQVGLPIILHSCGYQESFLEHYVDIGLDALQAFQPKAGNDLPSAFEKYGDRLAFITGIDIQQGEGMTPHEMSESILGRYQIGKHGRFVLGTTHMLQYTMPTENIHAILNTVREIQSGQHD